MTKWTLWTLSIVTIIAIWLPTAMAELTITLYPTQNDGTMAQFEGSGVRSSPGGSDSFSWSNLNGGDPFDASLNSAQFPLATGLTFTDMADIVALDFDSDGTGENQDDFTLRFSNLSGLSNDCDVAVSPT